MSITEKLSIDVLRTVQKLFLTKKFPECGSEVVDRTNLKVLYSTGERGDTKLFSFSVGYFEDGILVKKTKVFHLEDASDFLELDLTKNIEGLFLKNW